jgi:hypothetical protein
MSEIGKKVPIVFSIILVILMVAFIILYGFLTEYYMEQDLTFNTFSLGHLIMDTVFTLLGFGLLLSPYKNAKWSGMTIALYVVAFNIILGLLFQNMWFAIFFGFRTKMTNGNDGRIVAGFG